MRSSLQTIDGTLPQVNESTLAEAPLADPYTGPKRANRAVPSRQILIEARNGLKDTAGLLNEQAQQINPVSAATGQLATMTDLAASELAVICGEGLATFSQLMRFSRLAMEADCTNLVSSADIAQRMHTLARTFAQTIADAKKRSPCDSGSMPQVLQGRLDALLAAMIEAQSLCHETLGLAEELEQSIIASVEHSGEARARQKDIGGVIEQLNQSVQPLRAMATACDALQEGFSATRMQARNASQQFDLSIGQFEAATHLLSIHGINAVPADQYVPVARLSALVRTAATQAGQALADAVVAGLVNTDDLFDQLYYPAGSAGCLQHKTASTDFLRTAMPREIQPLLATMPEIAWFALVDRNGYQPLWLPTVANLPSQLIGEPGWVDAVQGVILEDETTVDAARRTHQTMFLQQGPYPVQATSNLATNHLPCEFFTPVAVNGRHWGSLRVGFALESTFNEPAC